MNKFKDGAFCFYRVSSSCTPMLPSAIEQLAAQHGMPEKIVPQYAGDRNQVARAISQVSSHLSRQGWLLRPIKQARHEVVYGIVKEQKDQHRERLEHDFEDTLRWSDEGGNGTYVEGTHALAIEVDTAYQALRDRVCPGDWTETLCTYLTQDCNATPMRQDGRIFYLPPQALDQVRQLTAFLAAVGISLVCCEIEAEAVPVVQQAASESLAEQLERLQEEVAGFNGEQKPNTYRLRLDEYARLRERATMYRESLGIGVTQAQTILDELEEKVRDMLTVRQATVIPRNGSLAGSVSAPTASVWQHETLSW
jgi:hypothetical protein